MAKRINLQGIRIHQTYEVGEAANLLSITPQTVRKWVADGMNVLNERRPMLILGCELKEYLECKQAKLKCKTALGEFMCMSCRKPQMPFGLMADYVPQNSRSGRLEALCGVCEAVCMRFSSEAKLPELSQVLQITRMPKGEPNGTSKTPAKT